MSSAPDLFKRSPNFLPALIGDDEIALFNPDNPENYFGLKETGVAIWKLLENPLSEEELVKKLCNLYDGSAEEVRADTNALLKELLTEGIVENVSN
ncbi:MAG: PqqD family protein [Rhizobiaceae bacterium]